MGSKKKNVFIHIGLHKTGTTAIQSALRQLQDSGELRKIGFQAHTGSLNNIAFEYMHFPEKKEEISTRLHKEISSYLSSIQKTTQDNIILSSEVFSIQWLNNDYELNAFSAPFLYDSLQGYNVKIIVYLRRQDTYIESFYAQKIKYGMVDKDMLSGVKLRQSLYYKKFLDDYAKYFGKENIFVRVYEKESLYNNDVIPDFFKIVGIDLDLFNVIISNKNNNISFSESALKIRYNFDTSFTLKENEKEALLKVVESEYALGKVDIGTYFYRKNCLIMNQDYRLSEKYNCLYGLFTLEKTGSFSNSGFMHPEERRAFLEQYEEDNAAVAREYLGREDGKLFNDNYPRNIISLEELNVKDVITIFVPIVQHYHEKFKEAECRFETIERRLGYIIRPWKIIPVILRRILKLIM